jgi:hypothetical protein
MPCYHGITLLVKVLAQIFVCIFKSLPCLNFVDLIVHMLAVTSGSQKAQYSLYWALGDPEITYYLFIISKNKKKKFLYYL